MEDITDTAEHGGFHGGINTGGKLAAPRDSNPDMLIQSSLATAESEENPIFHSAKSGKVRKNPHHRRTKTSC
jgi:hypothetical protein